MNSRYLAALLGAVLALGALAPAAPAAAFQSLNDGRVAALPLPRVSGNETPPASGDPKAQPAKRDRRACVFGVFPPGYGRCFAAAPAAARAA
jgi:hypothetical protein